MSRTTTMPRIGRYRMAEAILNGRPRVVLSNNTELHRSGFGIMVRLHNTDIVSFWPDDRVQLHSGGWQTVVTKDRINQALMQPDATHRHGLYIQVEGSTESGWTGKTPQTFRPWRVVATLDGEPFCDLEYFDGMILNLADEGALLGSTVIIEEDPI